MDHLSVTTNSQGTALDPGADIAYLKSFLPSILFWTGFTEKVEERAAEHATQVETLRARLPQEYMPPKHTIEIVNTLQVLVAAMVAMTDGKLNDMMEAAKVQKLEEKVPTYAAKDLEVAEVEAQPGSEPEPSVEGTAGGSAYDCRASVCSSTAISVDECKRMTEQVRPVPTQISPELQSAWEQCEALQAELNAMSVPITSKAAAESTENEAAVKEPLGLPFRVADDRKGDSEALLDRGRSFEQPESEHTPTSAGVDRLPSFRGANAPGLWDVGPTVLPPIEELRAEKRLEEKRLEEPGVSDPLDQQLG